MLGLLSGPLPRAGDLFQWPLDWVTLPAIGFLQLLTMVCLGQMKEWHRGATRKFGLDNPLKAYAVVVILDVAVAVLMLTLSWILEALGMGKWIALGILLAAIPGGFWTLLIAAMWWLAPMFQAQRDGSLPVLPPFPVRSLKTPALFALKVVFKGFLMAGLGIAALLIYDLGFVAVRYGISALRPPATSVSAAS
jgi:hypothetical protein